MQGVSHAFRHSSKGLGSSWSVFKPYFFVGVWRGITLSRACCWCPNSSNISVKRVVQRSRSILTIYKVSMWEGRAEQSIREMCLSRLALCHCWAMLSMWPKDTRNMFLYHRQPSCHWDVAPINVLGSESMTIGGSRFDTSDRRKKNIRFTRN